MLLSAIYKAPNISQTHQQNGLETDLYGGSTFGGFHGVSPSSWYYIKIAVDCILHISRMVSQIIPGILRWQSGCVQSTEHLTCQY